MVVKIDELRNILLSDKLKVINASIQNNDILIENWTNESVVQKYKSNGDTNVQRSGPKYTVLAKEENNYRIIEWHGILHTLSKQELLRAIKSKEIANYKKCGLINKDEEFSKLIDSKYNSFIAKTTMLGYHNITLEYTIENYEVKLNNYTGSNKDIIIPPFITAITDRAFSYRRINTVVLNDGLKVSGNSAFSFDTIDRIEIPDTVELIGAEDFEFNSRLTKPGGNMNLGRFKLRSNKTIVIRRSD